MSCVLLSALELQETTKREQEDDGCTIFAIRTSEYTWIHTGQYWLSEVWWRRDLRRLRDRFPRRSGQAKKE